MAPLFLLRDFLLGCTLYSVPEHVFFGIHQRRNSFLQKTGLQHATAQKREFLHGDPVLTNQRQVNAYREFAALSIGVDALERIPPDIVVLAKASQHELHSVPVLPPR